MSKQTNEDMKPPHQITMLTSEYERLREDSRLLDLLLTDPRFRAVRLLEPDTIYSSRTERVTTRDDIRAVDDGEQVDGNSPV